MRMRISLITLIKFFFNTSVHIHVSTSCRSMRHRSRIKYQKCTLVYLYLTHRSTFLIQFWDTTRPCKNEVNNWEDGREQQRPTYHCWIHWYVYFIFIVLANINCNSPSAAAQKILVQFQSDRVSIFGTDAHCRDRKNSKDDIVQRSQKELSFSIRYRRRCRLVGPNLPLSQQTMMLRHVMQM